MISLITGIDVIRSNITLTLLLIISIAVLTSIAQLSVDASVIAVTAAIELGIMLSSRSQCINQSKLKRD